MLLSGIAGACIVGIPLVFMLVFLNVRNIRLEQKIVSYQTWERQGLYVNVWILKNDLSAGEKITRANLEKKKIWVFESDVSELEVKIRQITGNRTKTALKKGDVIKSAYIDPKNESKQKNNSKKNKNKL